MGASVQVFRQLCIMLLYMLVGYTLYKKKILTEAGSKELAAMLVKIIIPAVIINSFCSEYTPERAQKIALSACPTASDGVAAQGLESVRSLQSQCTVVVSGLPVMFPRLGGKRQIRHFSSALF